MQDTQNRFLLYQGRRYAWPNEVVKMSPTMVRRWKTFSNL